MARIITTIGGTVAASIGVYSAIVSICFSSSPYYHLAYQQTPSASINTIMILLDVCGCQGAVGKVPVMFFGCLDHHMLRRM